MMRTITLNPVSDLGCSYIDIAKALADNERVEAVYDCGLPTVNLKVTFNDESNLGIVMSLLKRGHAGDAIRAAYLIGLRREYAPRIPV